MLFYPIAEFGWGFLDDIPPQCTLAIWLNGQQLEDFMLPDCCLECLLFPTSGYYARAVLVEEYTQLLYAAVENGKEWRDLHDRLPQIVKVLASVVVLELF